MDMEGELQAEGVEGEEGRWGMRVRVVWEVDEVAWCVVDVDACWVEEGMREIVDEGIGWRRDVEAVVRA